VDLERDERLEQLFGVTGVAHDVVVDEDDVFCLHAFDFLDDLPYGPHAEGSARKGSNRAELAIERTASACLYAVDCRVSLGVQKVAPWVREPFEHGLSFGPVERL